MELLSLDTPFGQVRNARIILEAYVLSPANIKSFAGHRIYEMGSRMNLDFSGQKINLEITRLLLLGWEYQSGIFLVIEEAENGTYTRLGRAELSRDDASKLLVNTNRITCVLG